MRNTVSTNDHDSGFAVRSNANRSVQPTNRGNGSAIRYPSSPKQKAISHIYLRMYECNSSSASKPSAVSEPSEYVLRTVTKDSTQAGAPDSCNLSDSMTTAEYV